MTPQMQQFPNSKQQKSRAALGGPLIVSVILHALIFLLVGSTIIFEKQILQSRFTVEELIPASSSDESLVEDDLLMEEPEEMVLDLPTDDIELEEVNTSAPNVSALADTITSTASIDTGFNISVPEGAMLEIGAAANAMGKSRSTGISSGSAGKVASKVNFFGLEAEGGNIMFIIDLSKSMRGAGRLPALQGQLEKSFKVLEEGTKVSVVCFAGGSWLFGTERKEFAKKSKGDGGKDKSSHWTINKGWNSPKPKWITVTKQSKSSLMRLAKSLKSDDLVWGTDWVHGFNLASQIPTSPEVVFFMTDGAMDGKKVSNFQSVAKGWSKKRFPIHGIFLGDPPKESKQQSDFRASKQALQEVTAYTKGSFKQVKD